MGRVSKTRIKKAIVDSGGVINVIAKRLGVSWDTARKYLEMWDDVQQLFIDESERILDKAEENLFDSVERGDVADSKWLLSRKGKARGYGDTGTEDNPLAVRIDGLDKLLDKVYGSTDSD